MKTDVKTLLKKLLKASEDVSDILHELEEGHGVWNGWINLSQEQDEAWSRQTEIIMETRAFLGMTKGDGE